MKKYFSWQVVLSLTLIALSCALYFLHYLLFRDARHIFLYLLGDIAFIPIEVLLVTLVIHRLLSIREKQVMLNKLNMVIGAFYSQAGTALLGMFSCIDPEIENMRKMLTLKSNFTAKGALGIRKQIKAKQHAVNINKADLVQLRNFLVSQRDFMLGLLENPNLLEHETFTELLWAVFHLTEELTNRPQFDGLPPADCEHLANDIKRAYNLLIFEWISYMEHLSVDYPYLFSLAMRINPFDPRASAVIAE